MTILPKISDFLLSVAVPVLFCAGVMILENFFPAAGCITACEDGPLEEMQALVAFVAFCLGISTLRASKGRVPGWAWGFFLIGTIGALYITLEELSYGQRIFGWTTPPEWAFLNDQGETNLHNTSAWFDQKPRVIFEIGVVIGGLVLPALRRWKSAWIPKKFEIVYPSGALFATAAVAILIHVYDSVTELAGRQDLFFIDRGSELQEICLFWFMMLYFLFKRRDFTSAKQAI